MPGPGLVLSCLGDDTLLSLPESGSHKVIAIYYRFESITIKLGEPWSDCQVQNFSSTSLTTPVYSPFMWASSLVNCSKAWNDESRILREWYRPISCLSSADHFVYVADMLMPVVLLPSDCVVVSANLADVRHLERGELNLGWYVPENGYTCQACESQGGCCSFDRKISRPSCSFCSFPEQPGELPYSFLL
ncbi:rust resistance kinase Lr10-like [Elaeis guineensis]|uniref:rust resistance kinase Lr10-like n=1 Tax=Elaeis guineensis var. tenera TaxID=51953 RepID=UPI003C6D9C0F